VWTTLRAPALEDLPKAATQKLRAFVELIEGYAQKAQTLGPHGVAEHVLDSTGYLSALRDADSVEADGRIENVQELLASVREFENEAETPTLSQYLELITLQTNADELDNREKLTLMTVHAAKGLEFAVVWVAGMEERLFPLSRGPNGLSHEDIEEERRLAYVALTRAEQRLFLSYARTRMLHGERMLGIPSPFLDELPEQHIARVSRVDESLFGGSTPRSTLGSVMGGGPRYEYDTPARSVQSTSAYPGRSTWSAGARVPPKPGSQRPPVRREQTSFIGVGGGAPKPARAPGESYVDRSDGDVPGEIQAGMLVRHAKYGEGSVISVEYGKPIRVTVRFAGWGVKQIVSTYLEAGG
jgi:DNA helicase-2/ATP-dependent DNA helicase PcrA